MISNNFGITIEKVICELPKCPPDKEVGSIQIKAIQKENQPLEYSINKGKDYQPRDTFSDLTPGLYTIWVRIVEKPETVLKYGAAEFPAPMCYNECEKLDDTCGTILFPGDLMISGFDNNINHGTDRILITNIVPIKTNTSFSIANVIYEGNTVAGQSTDQWLASGSNDPTAIASHRIFYIGKETIPAGMVICFDLPSHDKGSGMLAQNFKINGNYSSDFCVSNNGSNKNKRVNISTTRPDALFLLQGTWDNKKTHMEFCGRPISAIQHGAKWKTIDEAVPFPGRISRYHPMIRCFSIQAKLKPGSYAGYFSASESTYKPIQFFNHIMIFEKWIESKATSKNDLPLKACKNTIKVINPCAVALP